VIRIAGLIVVLLPLATSVRAATLDSMIEEYGRLYRSRAGSVEHVYDMAWWITDSLLTPDRTAAMDVPALSARLPGLFQVSDGLITVSPDVPAFLSLARARGDSVDVDFFETRSALENSNIWPKYVLQQTDHSGCTRFGSGAIVADYSAWVDFARRHPGRYRRWVAVRGKQALDVLVGGFCACGDRRSVISELEMFLARYPSGPAANSVQGRLKELRRGAGNVREHCITD